VEFKQLSKYLHTTELREERRGEEMRGGERGGEERRGEERRGEDCSYELHIH
jgi:hypothetical protein